MSIIKDAVIAELQEAMLKSTNYADIIDKAKTTTKKATYSKKMKKNNEKVANLLISLDKLDKA